MFGDSSSLPSSSPGSAAPMAAPPMNAGMSGTGTGGNPMSFSFEQKWNPGSMPRSTNQFMSRFKGMRQTQVGRYNSRPPTGLADTAGIQAMQSKLGSHSGYTPASKYLYMHTKRAALSPAIAGQDTSALGLALGVPPMNPQQPIGQPPTQTPAAMPPAPMGMQGAAPAMPGDPNQAAQAGMAQQSAMPGPAGQVAPGNIPPAPQPGMAGGMPQPPMPGDQPPSVAAGGNLVSGLAAQQEQLDENDPAAATEEIAIESAPAMNTGQPKIAGFGLGNMLGNIKRDVARWGIRKTPLLPALANNDTAAAMKALDDYGVARQARKAIGYGPVFEAQRASWRQTPKLQLDDMYTNYTMKGDKAVAARPVRDPFNGGIADDVAFDKYKIRNAMQQMQSAFRTGGKQADTRKYTPTYDPSNPALTPDDVRMASEGGIPACSASRLSDVLGYHMKNSSFQVPVFKGKKMVKDPYIEKIERMKNQKVAGVSDFAHSYMVRCAERGIDPRTTTAKVASVFGKEAFDELLLGLRAVEKNADLGINSNLDTADRLTAGGAGLAATALGYGSAAGQLSAEHGRGAASQWNMADNLSKATNQWPKPRAGHPVFAEVQGMRDKAWQSANLSKRLGGHSRIGNGVALLGAGTSLAAAISKLLSSRNSAAKTADWRSTAMGMLGRGRQAVNGFFRGAPKAAPPRVPPSNPALTAPKAPGTALVPYQAPPPAPRMPQPQPDFVDTTFQLKPRGSWNLTDRALGAAQGGFAGDSMEGPEGDGYGKWMGMLYGGAVGAGRRNGVKGMSAYQRPMRNAFAGGTAGWALDETAQALGMSSPGLETLGARGGLGLGLAGNAARKHLRAGGNAGWANAAKQTSNAVNNMAMGGSVPFTWAGNKAKDLSNLVFGSKFKPTPYVPKGLSGVNRAAYGLGGAAATIPMAGMALGYGADMLRKPISDAADSAVQSGLAQADQWAQQRGLMGPDGHLRVQGPQIVDGIIAQMGLDPSQMSNADKWALLGGGAAGIGGILSGNPMMGAAGMGAAAYGGRHGLMQLLGNAARYSNPGKNINSHVMGAIDPGAVRMTGRGW